MRNITVGQLLVNDALPEDMRAEDRVLDKKEIGVLLEDLARRHPDKYREVSHALSNIGWRSAQEFGGFSFGLRHLVKTKAGRDWSKRMSSLISGVLSRDDLGDDERSELIVKHLTNGLQKVRDDVFSEAKGSGSPLAMQVVSGSRGSPANISSLLASDALYTGHRDEPIPLPVLRSYSQGLTPAEYWGGTFGARRGVLDTKLSVQAAGSLGKQLNQIAHRLVVTDEDEKDEPTVLRGMPVDVDDPDNEGSLLAAPAGGYERNTVLTPKVLRDIRRKGADRILVRSPIVGGSPEGGVYARDVGVREYGRLPRRGEAVGMTAAQALAEGVTQAGLGSKHTGGIVGEGVAVSGYDYIEQLVQVPKSFKGGAAHATVNGRVSKIQDAPAGGKHIIVNGEDHYVSEGYEPKVNIGDVVEAGDVLSEGIPNPAMIVRFKGVGEGRRYFAQAMRQAMQDSGLKANRRNVELLSRGLIDHVRLDAEMGDYAPDDVVPYSTIERIYKPRQDAETVSPSRAVGRYLEQPVLHHTIGAQVRPSMLKDLTRFGVKDITVHREAPPFQSEMIRGMAVLSHDPDWMTRMYGSGLKRSLTSAVARGATSDERGTSFVPGLARAVDFGRVGAVRRQKPTSSLKKVSVAADKMIQELRNSWNSNDGKEAALKGGPYYAQTGVTQSMNPARPAVPARPGGQLAKPPAGPASTSASTLASTPVQAPPGPSTSHPVSSGPTGSAVLAPVDIAASRGLAGVTRAAQKAVPRLAASQRLTRWAAPVAKGGGKAAPWLMGAEAGLEGLQSYSRGRQMGAGPLAALGTGFRARNEDISRSQEDWSGLGGYLGQVGENWGQSTPQLLMSAPAETARTARSVGSAATAGIRAQPVLRSMQQGIADWNQQLAMVRPDLADQLERVFAPEHPLLHRVGVSTAGGIRYRDKRTGQLYTHEELPESIREAMRAAIQG